MPLRQRLEVTDLREQLGGKRRVTARRPREFRVAGQKIFHDAFILLGLAISVCSVSADDKWDISKLDISKLPPPADKKGVTYAKDIRPLFEASCFRCHGDDRPEAVMMVASTMRPERMRRTSRDQFSHSRAHT